MTTSDLVSAKQAVRVRLRAMREAQPPRRAARCSRAIARRVLRLSAWRRARVVFAYAAMRGEADPGSLVRRALAEGKTVALPRVVGPPRGRGPGLEFHRVGPETALERSGLGIPEPPVGANTRVDPASADLVLVPGVAFSPGGDRIGFGGGYYDRFLRGCGGVAVGIGFGFQVLAELPSGPGDAGVDAVVTERCVRFCRGRGKAQRRRSSTRVPPTKNWATASP